MAGDYLHKCQCTFSVPINWSHKIYYLFLQMLPFNSRIVFFEGFFFGWLVGWVGFLRQGPYLTIFSLNLFK